jgi:hypothetical protein
MIQHGAKKRKQTQVCRLFLCATDAETDIVPASERVEVAVGRTTAPERVVVRPTTQQQKKHYFG